MEALNARLAKLEEENTGLKQELYEMIKLDDYCFAAQKRLDEKLIMCALGLEEEAAQLMAAIAKNI